MNNYELHEEATELSDKHSAYNLARKLLLLTEEYCQLRDIIEDSGVDVDEILEARFGSDD